MADFSTRGLGGLALMVLGTAALIPAAAGMAVELNAVLFLGAVLLTVGTYLLGTDVEGTPV